MHTLHQFQALFGTFTRCPRRVASSSGTMYIILDTVDGWYGFETLTEIRYCVATGNADEYRLPF